jgi:hypothetical protein
VIKLFLNPKLFSEIKLHDVFIIFPSKLTSSFSKYFHKFYPQKKLVIFLSDIKHEKYNELNQLNNVEKICFDPLIAEENKIRYVPTYYDKNWVVRNQLPKNDLVFIGSDKGRKPLLDKIASFSVKNNLKFDYYLIQNNRWISFEEIIKREGNSKILLDIVQKGQNNVTLRSLHAFMSQKKLITDNSNIVNHPLYRQESILIIDDNFNEEEIINFINHAPEPNYSIEELYSLTFEGWLHEYIF